MSLSKESVELFSTLLDQVTISAKAPDLEEQAKKIAKARKEIESELEDA